jgi:peptide/nickel transport system permease protein
MTTRIPLRYIAGRVGQAVLVLWAAFTVSFVVLYLLPSDPVSILLSQAVGPGGTASAADVARVSHEYGLDQPVLVQYFSQLWKALHLDFGQSISQGQPVSALLAADVPPTLALAAFALLLTVVLGVLLSFVATFAKARWLRRLLERLPAVGVSLPTFFVGLLLIQFFSFTLHWFPAAGSAGFATLVLPAVTMALPTSGVLAQVLIRSLTDTQDEAYVTTARAKGLGRFVIHVKHVFRNAALPALTILGLLFGATVTQAVVSETVFSRVGVGRLAQEAVLAQDIPVVQGIVVIAAGLFVTINLVVDLVYPLLDPRVVTTPRVA